MFLKDVYIGCPGVIVKVIEDESRIYKCCIPANWTKSAEGIPAIMPDPLRMTALTSEFAKPPPI